MAKVIKAGSVEKAVKQVEIQNTQVMKQADGTEVTVVTSTQTRPVDEMITQAEAELKVAEARVTELKADIVEYKKIKG
tara:strand:+ start:188 stop:421 length:234 start_codon:yes stop_codon:yes gene_type:complete